MISHKLSIQQNQKSTEYNDNIAAIYGNRDNADTSYVAYRELPAILKSFGSGLSALDFGCGTGYSSFLLAEANYDVIGADINESMLAQARVKYPDINFTKVDPERTPFKDEQFDVILSAFVLLEINSIDKTIMTLKEIKRTLKNSGSLIILTTSEYFPKYNWLTGHNDIEKNININSGDCYQVLDIKNNMTFSDFFYDDKSYRFAFNEAGFCNINLIQPLGLTTDEIMWTNEWRIPPYSIYICSAQ
jgi:ubiquinone/menaquinone biosynthesis C-methylase UbiE